MAGQRRSPNDPLPPVARLRSGPSCIPLNGKERTAPEPDFKAVAMLLTFQRHPIYVVLNQVRPLGKEAFEFVGREFLTQQQL